MNIERLSLSQIKPYPNNPRKNKKGIAAVKGNGMWMRGGKLGADSWHMGQIGKPLLFPRTTAGGLEYH